MVYNATIGSRTDVTGLTTERLMNTSVFLCNRPVDIVFMVRTFKCYSLSIFQGCDTILLMIATKC